MEKYKITGYSFGHAITSSSIPKKISLLKQNAHQLFDEIPHSLKTLMESLANLRLPFLLRLPRPQTPRKLQSFPSSVSVSVSDAPTTTVLSAITELESTSRDPSSSVLGLSSRDLRLVLLHFSREGRDSYCALEVFEVLRREDRVDGETMELMVAIACEWMERIICGDHQVADVVGLLNEMECVGVEAGFSMVEKAVSLYWEREKKEEAVRFVRDVMRRGGPGGRYVIAEEEDGRGGPVGYLAWKMMVLIFFFVS